VWCLFTYTSSVIAQYKVEGGTKDPYLAVKGSDIIGGLDVYLVYGMEGVSISYTSSGNSHQWYRYKSKAIEGERIQAVQSGNTSTISNLEEGYGYGVVEGGNMGTARYVWLIDYSKYPVEIQNLHVRKDIDPCIGFQLDGTDLTPELFYQTPSGTATPLVRKYEISYNSQVWNETNKRFDVKHIIDTLDHPVRTSVKEPPLDDTDIKLEGDLYAYHFGVAKTYTSDFFTASRIEVYAEWIVSSEGTGNLSVNNNENSTNESEGGNKSEYLAPAAMRFVACGNKPVASFFKWKVYTDTGDTLVNYVGEEFEFTFTDAKKYTVQLEASDRTGKCVNMDHSFSFNITQTEMHVPNAFTPVGSPGINDVFKVAYQSVTSFKGWIFNRWGSELFYWNDPSKGWDGKYRGKYVPAGPYFYVIEYTGTDGKKRKKSGDVNVIHIKDNEKTEQ
jgi:gliding motility-associated-like protein